MSGIARRRYEAGRYLNVDLELIARGGASALLTALQGKTVTLHDVRRRGRRFVGLELLSQRPRTAEQAGDRSFDH